MGGPAPFDELANRIKTSSIRYQMPELVLKTRCGGFFYGGPSGPYRAPRAYFPPVSRDSGRIRESPSEEGPSG